MWAFLGGLFLGRGLRRAGLPDSVKQARYDARRARRVTVTRDGPSRGFVPLVIVLAVCCVVGLAYIIATA